MSRLQHKRGRKSNYVRSFSNNEYWQQVRKQIIARDRHCVICGSQLYLEVHHKQYYKNGVSIVGSELEHLDCLELLCSKCHQLKHKK